MHGHTWFFLLDFPNYYPYCVIGVKRGNINVIKR